MSRVAGSPILAPEVQSQLDLDSINFVSNAQLKTALEATTATAEQVTEAVRINSEARLRALKIGLLDHGDAGFSDDHPCRILAELRSG